VKRLTRGVALLALALLIAPSARAATAREMYAAAAARAKALRDEAAAGATARQYRAAAGAFEAIVRRHPTTGYADNSLLEAAVLSREAHRRSKDDRDKTRALRLLNWLVKEYPTSPLVERARAELRDWDKPAVAAVAPARNVAPDTPEVIPAAAVPPGTAVLRDIRRTVLGDIVRVTIELDAEVKYRSERVESPARVLFDLASARPGPGVAEGALSYPSDIVRHIRVGRHPNRVLRVVLDLEGVKRYSVFTLYGPYRIVVDCERAAALPPLPAEQIGEERLRLPAPNPETEPRVEPPPKPLPGRALRPVSRPVAPEIHAQRMPPAEAAPVRVPALDRRPAGASSPEIRPRRLLARNSTSWQPAVHEPPGLPAPEAAVSAAATAASPAARAVTSGDRAAPPVERPASPADQPVMASQPLTPPPNGFSMARQLGLGASRIVIDPGHGGHDPGAEGFGTFEATIVLDVALRLEKLLASAGIDAVLTRRKDHYIPLEERTAIANRAQGDLFLSIHANASRNRAARGVESYFLNFATTPDAEAVAARENASTGLTMSSLTGIVKAIALNNKLDESKNFAGVVQREMMAHLAGAGRGTRNHGVKQAPFVVLIGASMPSVLVEISFITHAQEGRLLKTGAYRQKIAEALFAAIRGYQKSLKGSTVLTRQ
jgi:N-acetylmuramoyl-L-alanine amidase